MIGTELFGQVFDKLIDMAEINFLCVHKKLRSKRLAPVLIKEGTVFGLSHGLGLPDVVRPSLFSVKQVWRHVLSKRVRVVLRLLLCLL